MALTDAAGARGLVADLADLADSRPDVQLLERIALALTSTAELEDVLHELAVVGLDATGAGGTAILLLEGRSLRPAAVARVLEQNNLQERFHRMAPVHLDPLQWELLAAGRAIALEDARKHDLVPSEWVDAFTLRGLALVPLMAGGEPCGLMAVDWDEVRAFAPSDIALLESIGAYAGIAVHVAQLFATMRRRARLQQALAQSAANLAWPLSPETIATRLVDSYADLLGARLSALALLDEERREMRTVASRGTRAMDGALPVTDVPQELVSRLVDTWKGSKQPVELGDHPWLCEVVGGRDVGAAWYLVLPLVVDGLARGAVLLGFAAGARLDDEERSAAEALADIAAAALGRHELLARLDVRLRQVEALSRLSDVVSATADVNAAMPELDLLVRPELAARFESISLADAGLRESVRARTPDRSEAAAVRSWRAQLGRGGRARPRAAAGDDGAGLLVPVVHRNRVHGALRVSIGASSSAVTTADEDLLVAVGAGCGEIVHKAALQRELSERERRLAISAERERIARDLHDSVGQVMTGMGMLLHDYVENAPDAVWRERFSELAELAGRGSTEVRKSIYSLLFLDTRRHGLAPSLDELAAKFQATTGIRVAVTVPRSDAVHLTSPREEALFRAAHEALINVERHANASSVELVVTAGESDVVLTIADDGTGFPSRFDGPDRGHFGLDAVLQRLEEVGGTMRLTASASGGALLEARVPARVTNGGRG